MEDARLDVVRDGVELFADGLGHLQRVLQSACPDVFNTISQPTSRFSNCEST